MRFPFAVRSLIAAVVLTTAGAAHAAMPVSAVGVLHQYCSDEAASTHPTVVLLEQPVMTDALATFGGTGFIAQYTRDDLAAGSGKMVVRIKIRRLDGSVERVGKILAWQGPSGVAAEGETFPLAVRRGDTLFWKYRFRDFQPVAGADCVLLVAAIGDASLARDE